MTLEELAELIGIENLLTEIENWMPSDELEEMIEDVKRSYDLC